MQKYFKAAIELGGIFVTQTIGGKVQSIIMIINKIDYRYITMIYIKS